ncbi:MAG: hypothetical protein KBH93_08885 [Anaerolineae bacterium]|nr:hypothetical protein [Anaerolineae bacterium]
MPLRRLRKKGGALSHEDEFAFRKYEIASNIDQGLEGLEIQRARVLRASQDITQNPEASYSVAPNHDADFYLVLLRRMYRVLENTAKENSRVANLKGQYKDLYPKIKMRDHSEHMGILDIPPIREGSPIIVKLVIVINENRVTIVSGDQEWNLDTDHGRFVELMRKFLALWLSTDEE